MNDVAVRGETFAGFYIFSECSIHDFESYTQRL
jgi:hypothetical protein